MLKKSLISLFLLPLAVGSCTNFGKSAQEEGTAKNLSFVQAMENLEKYTSEVWIFFLESCPLCQRVLPFAKQYVEENNEGRLYFIDREILTDSQSKSLFQILKAYFDQDDPALEKGKLLVPSVAAINKGIPVKAQTGIGQDKNSVYDNLNIFLGLIG